MNKQKSSAYRNKYIKQLSQMLTKPLSNNADIKFASKEDIRKKIILEAKKQMIMDELGIYNEKLKDEIKFDNLITPTTVAMKNAIARTKKTAKQIEEENLEKAIFLN